MTVRVGYALSALLLGVSALVGSSFSSATFTDDSATPTQVTAAADWAAPTTVVTPLDAGIFGTVTVTATASDDRSDIAAIALEYAPAGTSDWVTLTTGCTASSGPSPLTYSCQWDTTTVVDDDYAVRAVATDTATPIGFTAASASVPTQVANDASVVLTPVASPTRGTVTLRGTLLNAGNGSRSIRFEYAVAGSSAWQGVPGCTVGTTSEHTCSFDTTALNGQYDVRAVGTRAGSTFHDVQTDVLLDNTAPVVSLTAPAGVLSKSVQLTAEASDVHSAVASVTLEYQRQGDAQWVLCGAPTSAPYSCTFDSTTVPDGTYDLRAVATDAVGNTSAVATQTRAINNSPGAVEVSLPSGGATVSGSAVAVTASASSPRGVASVSIEYRAGSTGDFTRICADSSSPYACSWNVSGLSNGAYQLRAVMTEASGGAALSSSAVSVSVDNSAGSLTWTSPGPGATVTGSVALSATAVPAGGKTVASVKFYGPGGVTGPVLCTATLSGPTSYACSWSSSSVAYDQGYQLHAVLTHGDGTTLTAGLVVKVDNVTGSVSASVASAVAGYARGTVDLNATATSNAPIASVRLATRTTPSGTFTTLCTDDVAPYSCPWNTTATSYGTSEVQAVVTLANGSTRTSTAVAVTVDNRQLAAADVQATASGTAGQPSAGDRLLLRFSGLVNPGTVVPGLSYGGPAVSVNASLVGGIASARDRIDFTNAALGSVTFAQNYVAGNSTITINGSTVAASQVADPTTGHPVTLLTVTLGTPASAPLNPGPLAIGAMAWTPSTAVQDLFGTASLATAANESGGLDADL